MDDADIHAAFVLLVLFSVVWTLGRNWGNTREKSPQCGKANTVQRLNFVSEEDRKAFYAYDDDGKVETFIDCKKCGHRYVQTYVLPQATAMESRNPFTAFKGRNTFTIPNPLMFLEAHDLYPFGPSELKGWKLYAHRLWQWWVCFGLLYLIYLLLQW